MRARFLIESPASVEMTLKITMTMKEWDDLRAQLGDKWPSWKFSSMITALLTHGRRVFHEEQEEGP